MGRCMAEANSDSYPHLFIAYFCTIIDRKSLLKVSRNLPELQEDFEEQDCRWKALL